MFTLVAQTIAMRTPATSRRNTFLGLLCALLGSITKLGAKSPEPKYHRVQWKKLHNEPVGPGDMWVCHETDPNTPERQSEDYYNLQMQAIHGSDHGTPAKDICRGNGDYWRPVGIVPVF
jgi:hypothetical protein